MATLPGRLRTGQLRTCGARDGTNSDLCFGHQRYIDGRPAIDAVGENDGDDTEQYCAAEPPPRTCRSSQVTVTAATIPAGTQFHGAGTAPSRAICMTATTARANCTNESA